MRRLWKKPEIESQIKLNFPSISEIRLHSAVFDEEKEILDLEFLVDDKIENQKELLEFLKEKFNCKVDLKLTKSYFDEDFLERKIQKYFALENGFLKNKISRDDYAFDYLDGKHLITFLGDVNFCGYINTGVKQSLEKYLYRSFIGDFEVSSKVTRQVEEIKAEVATLQNRAVVVKDIKKFIGTAEGEMPAFICDVEGVYDRAILSGVVSNIVEKIKKDPKPFREGQKVNEKYYTFELADVSGRINCTIYPSISNNDKIQLLDGKEIVASGKIRHGRMGEFELVAKNIAFCQIVTKEAPPSKFIKDEPMYYSTVFPSEVVLYQQENLLEEKKPLDLTKLMGKTIVVFDLETTGLSPIHDRIVEIGAVKIVDGEIIEKFSTLINPEVMMTEKNMSIHGITNEEVLDKPKIQEVMLDFYKFCYGSILCGHNIKGFDIPFIRENARRMEFDFFNPQIDTYEMAVRYVKGSKNNKLGSLCDFFGVNNMQAHRAYEDAIATGQVLMHMLSDIPEAVI